MAGYSCKAALMSKLPPLPAHLDTYEGWQPSSSNPRIAKVTNQIKPAEMWTHFISQRRPVVIDGLLRDPDFNAAKWTNLEYLRSTAGHVPVKIEPVHPSAGHFGTSVKRSKVKFSEFLQTLQDVESAGKWYLTTQYVDDDETADSSHPSTPHDPDREEDGYEPELDNVLPAPTNALSNDFPHRPALLGNLVLQQCNLWLGNSKEGKSSGLHHDFHDNLYILLSGYKRFLLFPPSAHRFLHPRGCIDRVYPNGLIVYTLPGELPSYVPVAGRKPQLPIRPDGLVPSEAARWRRKARLRVKREIDERAAAEAGEGSRHKSQRKGKAKQTRLQELAEEAFLQAEAELRICRMDEEGIDPEDDSLDDGPDFDDDDSNPDLDGLLNTIIDFNANPLIDSCEGSRSEDENDSQSDDDDDDDQARRLMDSLPAPVKHIGMAALAGDPASMRKLRAYLDSVAESDHSDDESDHEHADANDSSDSEALDDTSSADNEQQPGLLAPSRLDRPNGLSHKRKNEPLSDDAHDSDNRADQEASDTIESSGTPAPPKRVKIASLVDTFGAARSLSGDSHASSEESDSQTQEPDLGDSDDDSEPGFLGADSGSEFGDVNEGEAQLERLLAMAEQDADAQASPAADDGDEDNEPQSFSRIPPHVLHRCLNIPDDPSRPMAKQSHSGAGARKNKAAASEPYTVVPGCPPPIEVFLKPGQMLYLPASWYHEVTSSSLPPLRDLEDITEQSEEPSKVHMALNYWFHPPDALEFEPVESRQGFDANGQGRASSDIVVPGLGVGLGESAIENRGNGTGTHERPYRDAEVWDEVAHAVAQQIKLAKESVSR